MKLIESILSSENVIKAQSRVISNKGCAGIDGMHVDALVEYMRTNWMGIKESILARKYKPAPVRRVEIPKPNGGVRKLGIPTVLDRTIQQAIVQVLSPIFENEFQEHSYGFRPCRSCEQAVLKFLDYLNEGYEWIVDIDLEKFFDKVPQDKLMSYVGRVICDPDTESLICKYLKLLVSAKPFSLFKKIKGRFPFLDSDLFRYFVLAKELYNDEQKYTFYRTADVRPTTFFT